MAKSSGLLLIAAIFIATFVISCSRVDASSDYQLGWIQTTRSTCDGSIGECLDSDEFEMDTEINRRILATSRYISYGALKRNTVPCSRRGASYYNCKRGAQANPYSRGCSHITRCRG